MVVVNMTVINMSVQWACGGGPVLMFVHSSVQLDGQSMWQSLWQLTIGLKVVVVNDESGVSVLVVGS